MKEAEINRARSEMSRDLTLGEREIVISRRIVEIHDWLVAYGNDTSIDIEEFHNTRNFIAEIVAMIKNLELSDDLLLDATLVYRLAERAVGKAVRRAQAEGKLGSLATNRNAKIKPPSPIPYVGGGNSARGIYILTDGVTDSQFAQLLKDARKEGNLSRGYLVRIIEERGGKKKNVGPRQSLVEQAREIAEQLRKATIRLSKLQDDERLLRNKAEVAARMRPYLDDAVRVCTDLKNTLEEQSKDEGK